MFCFLVVVTEKLDYIKTHLLPIKKFYKRLMLNLNMEIDNFLFCPGSEQILKKHTTILFFPQYSINYSRQGLESFMKLESALTIVLEFIITAAIPRSYFRI